ncbi:MAG: asparagine synthetase B family protein, partial [Flavobacteriaceae bacterium]|nr:asparagine synthetase B family protein [Flavobacteriaceae bacterium]
KTTAYSYAFQNGLDETKYGKQIANKCDFPFQAFKIQKGYLWNIIEDLSEINKCYSEFTHPRQMAIRDSYAAMGDVFSLGHWGDVLFDDMGAPDRMSNDEQVDFIMKKVVKKGGMELAQMLWNSWGLQDDFNVYLKQRIFSLIEKIDIPENANAQIRAFKSLYWAPRWTSINLSVFESVKPVELPYYHPRMCEFICSIPESHLAGRQIQIEYIKRFMPSLAKIPWEAKRPFNLYNYHLSKVPWNLPYRVVNKFKRMLFYHPYIQRNWELQFLGEQNEIQLKNWLFEQPKLDNFIDGEVRERIYSQFKEKDNLYYSHAVSMLLTFSLFAKKYC